MSPFTQCRRVVRCLVLGLCLAMAAAAGTVAHAQGSVADRSKWPARLTFATGPVGGFGHTTGSPWASVIGTEVGVPLSVESTAGFPINVLMLEERKADVGISTSDVTFEAWEGADWTKDRKLRAQRTLMVLGANALQIYTPKNSGIKTISDINGRSANPSRRRSGSDLMFRDLLETLNIKPARITNVSPGDANGLLGDGRLDVAVVTGSPPHPAVSEFDTNNDTVLIGLTDAERQKFLQKYPYFGPYDIPAGTYKGVSAPVKTVASYVVVVVRADMPDSLAYALVKATFDKQASLAGAHKSFAQIAAKDILYSTVPVHPGAARFYAERGVALPAKLKGEN